MIEEKVIDAAAADTAGGKKQDTGRALGGKIARLPKAIREQLNRRLDDGQPGSEILPWLNERPAVKRILAAHFGGAPVNEQNLCNWRSSGYERWLKKQEPLADIKNLAEDAGDFSRASRGNIARGTAAIVAARILKMLDTIPPEKWTADDLAKISHAVAALYNAEQNSIRLKHEKARVRLQDEKLTLNWDIHMRKDVSMIQQALKDAQIKAIQALPIDNRAKIELIGRIRFRDVWQGRPILEAEEEGDAGENGRAGDQNHSGGPPPAM